MKRAIESLLQTRSRSSEREMGKQAEAGGEIERLLLFFWVLLLLTLIFFNFCCRALELHSAIALCDTHASLVLSNFPCPRASITQRTHANHKPNVKKN